MYLFFLAPQEEPISVMDLENRVSRRLWALPTESRCCQAGNLWISVFKDRTAILSIMSLRPIAERPIPTRIWIAGGQNFSLAGAVQVAGTAGDAGHELRNGSGTLRRGDREFMLPVRVVPGAAPGTHNLVVSASYQSCNNKLCLPPKTMKAEVPVTIGK